MYYWLVFLFIHVPGQQDNPVELGDVQWLRSLEKAQEQSGQSGKPILILFQEVPGCATCRNYGNDVLTDPLVVEAIETCFVPLAIYNNRKGADAEALNFFGEPAWNNPVVRAVDQHLADLQPRLNEDYTRPGLADYMTRALIHASGRAPKWLHLVSDAWNVPDERRSEVVYSMPCFWTGEAHFGKLNGVLATEPGFANGLEVVRVTFDSAAISKKQLDAYARKASCGIPGQGISFRPDHTPQYYLSKSPYARIDLLPIQRTRVNSALSEGQDPSEFLSPRQLMQMASK